MTMGRMFSLLVSLVLLLALPAYSALGEAAMELDIEKDNDLVYQTEAAVEGRVVPFIVDYSEDENRREREFTLYLWTAGIFPMWNFRNTCPC